MKRFLYILRRRTDGRKFPYILISSIDELRKILLILLMGVINRMLLNILPMQNPPKKLLEQVKDQIQLKHYPYRTEETYI
jgi:hypothetical protein